MRSSPPRPALPRAIAIAGPALVLAACANHITEEVEAGAGELAAEAASVHSTLDPIRNTPQSALRIHDRPFFGSEVLPADPSDTLPQRLSDPTRVVTLRLQGGSAAPAGRATLIDLVERQLDVRVAVDPDTFTPLQATDEEGGSALAGTVPLTGATSPLAGQAFAAAVGTRADDFLAPPSQGGSGLDAAALAPLPADPSGPADTGTLLRFLRTGYRDGPLRSDFEADGLTPAALLDEVAAALDFRTWRYASGVVYLGLWHRLDYTLPTMEDGLSKDLNEEIRAVIAHHCGACYYQYQPRLRTLQIFADPFYRGPLDGAVTRLVDRLSTQLLVQVDLYTLDRELSATQTLDFSLSDIFEGLDLGFSYDSTGGLVIGDADAINNVDDKLDAELTSKDRLAAKRNRMSALVHSGLPYEFRDVTKFTAKIGRKFGGATQTGDDGAQTVGVETDDIREFERSFIGRLSAILLDTGDVRLYYTLELKDVDQDSFDAGGDGESATVKEESVRAKETERKFENEVTLRPGQLLLLSAYQLFSNERDKSGGLHPSLWFPKGANTDAHILRDYLLAVRVHRTAGSVS